MFRFVAVFVLTISRFIMNKNAAFATECFAYNCTNTEVGGNYTCDVNGAGSVCNCGKADTCFCSTNGAGSSCNCDSATNCYCQTVNGAGSSCNCDSAHYCSCPTSGASNTCDCGNSYNCVCNSEPEYCPNAPTKTPTHFPSLTPVNTPSVPTTTLSPAASSAPVISAAPIASSGPTVECVCPYYFSGSASVDVCETCVDAASCCVYCPDEPSSLCQTGTSTSICTDGIKSYDQCSGDSGTGSDSSGVLSQAGKIAVVVVVVIVGVGILAAIGWGIVRFFFLRSAAEQSRKLTTNLI